MKLCVIILIIILIRVQKVTAQTWFNNNWLYRKSVTINNSNNSNNLTDYQVNVVLDGTSNFDFGKALADGDDLRVTDDDGTTPLPFWIETWSPPYASIWVKVPTIPANDTKLIYLYFGNSVASSASSGDSTFVFFDSFESFDPNGMNASNFLTTPTYDGSGQTVHPDILYIPEGWGHNNYKYWMAITPFRNGNDVYENPSILASNNGLTWVEPQAGLNPLVPPPSNGFNSDPDLILVNNELVLYYRETNDVTLATYLMRMTSTDGINWVGPQIVLTSPYLDCTSPALIYENNTWYMWYVSGDADLPCNPTNFYVVIRTSSDGVNWGAEQIVNIELPGSFIWHLDVQKDGSKYTMIFPAFKKGLGCLDKGMSLFYAESNDRINWTVNPTPLLRPSLGWDDWQIYRSTFLVNGNYFRIWYSSRNPSDQWHTGYTEGELNDFLNQSRWEETNGEVLATTEHPRSGNYSLKEIGGQVNGYDPPHVFKNFSDYYSFNAWLYDDGSTNTGFLAVLQTWYLNNSLGVGIFTNQSRYNYVYQDQNSIYHTTSIPRSTGWHKLTINKNGNLELLIDDTQVGSFAVSDIDRISLSGLNTRMGWFDDVYVREYSDPEPDVSVSPVDEALPVELLSFTAQASHSEVLLQWETASEVNNLGFILLRSLEKTGQYQEISSYVYNESLKGAGNTNTTHLYSHKDIFVQNGLTYWYKLVDVDYSGAQYEHPAISVTLPGDRNPLLSNFTLFQSYPNPFNSVTNIAFNIPEDLTNSRIRLEIYDMGGKKIKTLLNTRLGAGYHSAIWNATNDRNETVSSGMYIYELIVSGDKFNKQQKKMLLLK